MFNKKLNMNKSACDFPNVLAWSLISGITCTLERASLMEWPAVLKVSVTGKPGTFFLTLRRCSLKRWSVYAMFRQLQNTFSRNAAVGSGQSSATSWRCLDFMCLFRSRCLSCCVFGPKKVSLSELLSFFTRWDPWLIHILFCWSENCWVSLIGWCPRHLFPSIRW